MPRIHTRKFQEVLVGKLGDVQEVSFLTYGYSELSDDAKEIAVNRYSKSVGSLLDDNWCDLEHGDFAERLDAIGIEIDERTIRSSVGSQGSGASFAGSFNTDMERPDQKKLEAKYGTDAMKLLGYFDEMQNIAKGYFVIGKINMTPSHYAHSGCMVVDASAYRRIGDHIEEMSQEEYDERDIDAEFGAIFRTLANLLYEKLCNEYHYLLSDEAIMDKLSRDHSVRFFENGELCQEA